MGEDEKKANGIPMDERETVIQFGRLDEDMTIYTTDETMMTKLNKCVEAGNYEVVEVHKLQNGRVIGKTYKANKKFLSLRSKDRIGQSRNMTDEEKRAFVERTQNARKNKS